MKELARLASLLKYEKMNITLAVACGFVAAISSVGLMATSAYLIAQAALHPPLYTLTLVIVGVRFFGLARAGFRYLERYVSHRATFSILGKLRVFFYERIEPLAPAIFQHHRSGDLLSRVVSDVESLQYFFLRIVYPPLILLLVFIATSILLGSFDVQLAWYLIAGLLAVGLIMPIILTYFSGRIGAALSGQRGLLATGVTDLLFGYVDLKTNSALQQKTTKVVAQAEELEQKQRKATNLSGLSESLQITIAFITAWTILVVAIKLVEQDAIGGVYLALIVLAALTAFEAASPMATIPWQLEDNRTAAQRLFSLNNHQGVKIKTPDYHQAGTKDLKSESINNYNIKIKDLSFAYPGQDRLALENISLNLEEGKKIAVIGHSGSGKSTLVNLLLRFYDCAPEKILFGDRDIREYAPDQIRSFFGVVAQANHFFNDTVRENLLLAKPQATDEELIQVLKQVSLNSISLDQGIGERGLALSGGERQRLAVARMVLKDAPVLLLDEPTANLDGVTERQILDILWPLAKGKTVLYITHRKAGLEDMDQILKLDNGRLIY